MIDNLIGFSIKNKLIIGIFILGLIAWGVYSLTRLPIDAVPDITNNQVQVITTVPTIAAQEVERSITFPVEISMATIPDVVEIRSISRFGLSVVTIVFKDEVDVLDARQMVSERMKKAQEQIPPGLGTPELAPITTGLGEIYQYVLHTKPGFEKKYSPTELRTIQDWIVKRQLLGTPGVADISSFGGYLKQYEIAVRPEKLKSFGITFSEIFDALAKNNQNTGGAYIDKKPNAYFIRGLGLVTSIDDIEKIVIRNFEGVPILIRDVANVQIGSAVRYGAMTRNTEGEVVGGLVLMLKGENSNAVIKHVKDRVETIAKTLPEGVVIEPFLDRSHLVERAIHTVSKNLIEGGLIVIFILILFLGNLRAGLVVASVIPLSMLFAIGMMTVFGVSGNLMSLGAIDFGLIVDGAVIIVEAIVHRITSENKFPGVQRLTQEQMDAEVLDASVNIRKSAAFGEIIIMIVYLPILSLVGIEGKMFKPMAQTVSFAILGALILSLTYVPMMSALFLSKKTVARNVADKIMAFIHKLYHPVLLFALRSKKLILGIALIFLVASIFVFSLLGGEFIPTLEEGDFAVETRIMPGSSLSQTIETALKSADILKNKFPEVKEVIGKVGTSEIPTDPMPIESCDLIIVLKNKDEWTSATDREELAGKMNEALSALPGVEFSFQQPIQMRFNELMTGARQDIAIKIYGDDMEVLADKAKEAAKIIEGTEGVGDMFVEQVSGLPQIVVEYNRDRIARYGLNISELNTIIRTAFAGEAAGLVFEGERRFDLVVRLLENSRKDIEDVRSIYIPLPSGNQIPITEVANIEYRLGPMQISRQDTKRKITIGINVREKDVESVVKEIQQKLNSHLKLDPGYHVVYGGQFENLIEAKQRLFMVMPVALFLILVLLFFTFDSLRQSILIFTAIPFAAIGGVFALFLRGMPFSISAGVGFIALSGVAVLNGIVLIGYFNHLKKDGITDLKERVIKGTEVRLRPVLMTATVASLGFLPMALSTSAGAEVQKPLATVVIGGLITSTILTLIVLPILYIYSEKLKKKNMNSSSGGKTLGMITILIGLFALPLSGNGQIRKDTFERKVTLNQAIQIALENNPSVKTAVFETEQQRQLKRTSYDINKTMVGLSYGQYNSFETDNAFTVSQLLAFPTVYSSTSRLMDRQITGSQYRLALTKNELMRNVKIIYYQLMLVEERNKMFLYQDSLYSNFKQYADLRFETGEAAYLEKISAETRLLEVKNAIYQNRADYAIYANELQKLLNTSESLTAADSSIFYKIDLPTDTSVINQNPYLKFLHQQIVINEAFTKIERARFLPDFSVGITSQTLKGFYTINSSGVEKFYGGNNRFQYVNVGVGIPLWFGPHKARIESAKIGEKIAASNYENQKLLVEAEFQRLVQTYLKLQNTLIYYESKAIPQADLMIEFADKSYKAGEISYMEFIQNLTHGLQIKLDYLNILDQFNQTNINLEFIIGGQ